MPRFLNIFATSALMAFPFLATELISNVSTNHLFRPFLQASAAPLPTDRVLFLKGTFDGWTVGVPFRAENSKLLQASISLHPGRHEFKVADDSWSFVYSIDANQATQIPLSNSRTLVPAPGSGNNSVLKLTTSSTYLFQLDISDRNSPKLSVVFGGPYVSPSAPFTPIETRNFGRFTSAISIDTNSAGQRNFQLFSDAPQRDGTQKQNLTFVEDRGSVQLRSGSATLDTVFALAVKEAAQNETRLIRDSSFNRGAYIPCDCYVTGEKWGYVWTRDAAYSSDLGLAWLNGEKMWNSLLFKTSNVRFNGGKGDPGKGPEIVQDTGTGGSWPVSTDRVTWALGANAILKELEAGVLRTERLKVAFAVVKNTLERDRNSVFDLKDQLYSGEQSFLDWREQSYPYWTRSYVSAIAESKALSTNVVHLMAIKIAADWARELGETETAERYEVWARELKSSIRTNFYDSRGRDLSSLRFGGNYPITLSGRKDLLSLSLAALAEVISPEEARVEFSKYPVTQAGSPVIWPQSAEVPIYHNRSIWPFVSAYAAKAARVAKHGEFVARQAMSLIRTASLHQSNMENLEFISGDSLFEDGAFTGPVINSKRQLWSVAATLSLFRDTFFGLSVTKDSLEIKPFIPHSIYNTFLSSQKEMRLENVPIAGRTITIALKFPNLFDRAENASFSIVKSIRVNGSSSSQRKIALSELRDGDVIEVELDVEKLASSVLTELKIEDPYAVTESEKRRFLAAQTPYVSSVTLTQSGVQLALDSRGAGNTEWDLFRNGKQIVAGFKGTTYVDSDQGSSFMQRCYVAVQRTIGTLLNSEPSAETCTFVGNRTTYDTKPESISKVGRLGVSLARTQGNETIEYTPFSSGVFSMVLEYSNAYNDVSTGITAATRSVEVIRALDGQVVFKGLATMPHLPRWDVKGMSSSLRFSMNAGEKYLIKFQEFFNMSNLSHYVLYDGAGGKDGPLNAASLHDVFLSPLENPF